MIGVLGSINMDLVAKVSCFPRLGETLFGRTFACYPGGKGANAAVDPAYVDRVFSRLVAAKVLLQLEVPMEAIAHLLRRLPPKSPLVILDPVPAQDISGLPLERVDIITPKWYVKPAPRAPI